MLKQLAELSSPDFPHGPPAFLDNSHYAIPPRSENAEPSRPMPGRHQKTRPRTFRLDDFLALGHQLRGRDAPALICLGGGLWDLAYWGRRDRAAGRPVSEPLTAHQLDWWQGRMLSVIRLLKAVFPDTPIWFRTLHRVGENFWASHDWGIGVKMGHGFVNFFSDAYVPTSHRSSSR